MAVQQLRRAVPGGIGAYARGLLSGLAQATEAGDATDITLYASRPPRGRTGGGADPLTRFGHPVIGSRLPGPVMTRAWDLGWLGPAPGFDIIHSVSLAAPPARASRGERTVVTVHDLSWRRYPEGSTPRGRRWHEAALARARDSAAALVVTSNLVAADLEVDGVAADRLTIVHGGSDHLVAADMARTDTVLDQLGVHGDFLLTVGTLEPRKNIGRLISAYGLARPALPEPWPMVIVGPDGWGPALRDRGSEAGVVFAGEVADPVLSGLYGRARAFAYVPLTEGYGLPPLEAMRFGTPTVVSAEVPSVHDLAQSGVPPARIVDPLNVEDIAAGLVAVATDDVVRADLSARGGSYSRARTWRAAAQAHIDLWGSLA